MDDDQRVIIWMLLRQAERYVHEGLHPHVLVEGMELARDATFVDEAFVPLSSFKKAEADSEKKLDAATDKNSHVDRELLRDVVRMSLRTQLSQELVDHMTDIMIMVHKSEFYPKLVKGVTRTLPSYSLCVPCASVCRNFHGKRQHHESSPRSSSDIK